MIYASFRSIGAYVPSQIRDNDWFIQRMDTSDEWITKRTGIKQRRIAAEGEMCSDMGVEAAKLAISRAKLNPQDIDLIVCATISPDFLCMPSTACIIGNKLGLNDVMAFDISAACTGFVYCTLYRKGIYRIRYEEKYTYYRCRKAKLYS